MSDPVRQSSYLQYLPPILWDHADDPFIGRFLLGFEKILTGVDDGHEVRVDVTNNRERQVRIATQNEPGPVGVTDSRAYESFESMIDGIHHLFNPRRTRPEFLNYLASWLAFDANLPVAEGLDSLKRSSELEARTRARIARLARIYRTSGLKRGLLLSVDVFTASRFRPRIAVDDGESLFRLQSGGTSADRSWLTAIASAGSWPYPDRDHKLNFRKWLLAPQALAVGTDGIDAPYLIVADGGPSIDPAEILLAPGEPPRPPAKTDPLRPALWRISLSGEPLDWSIDQGNPYPIPLNDKDFSVRSSPDRLLNPRGVVVDDAGTVFVLDLGLPRSAKPALLVGRPTLASADGTRRYDFTFLVTRAAFEAGFTPLDLAADKARRVFFVTGFSETGDTCLLIIRVTNLNANPPVVKVQKVTLTGIQRPAGIAVQDETNGEFTLLIADSRQDRLDEGIIPPKPYPDTLLAALAVDIVRVGIRPNETRTTIPAESLIVAPKLPRQPVPPSLNPLIGPTSIAIDPKRPTRILVCDTGMKFKGNSQLSVDGNITRTDFRVKAEPARIFEIELGQAADRAVIRTLTPDPQLVSPTRIAIEPSSGTVFVTDEGIQRELSSLDTVTALATRHLPNRLRLSLIFSGERPPQDSETMDQTFTDLERVVSTELPAHVGWHWEFRDDSNPIRPSSSPSQ